jgi:glycosyl transferase family 25
MLTPLVPHQPQEAVTTTAPCIDFRMLSFVINLDRSYDRWKHIHDEAGHLGLDIKRVAAVDGALIDPNSRPDYDHDGFLRRNGRPMLPEEYGCYLAHLKALRAFLESDAEYAVILEDDVSLRADLVPRVQETIKAAPFAEVIKLLNHRAIWFRPVVRSRLGDSIGKCFFGPQGSAACYLVTRGGAEKALAALRRIELPFDVALERGWKTKLRVYSVRENVVELSVRSRESQIADRAKYRSIKLTRIKRIPTHCFRVVEFFRRVLYAAS